MAKYKIIIEKYIEEEIEAENQNEAEEIAWEIWSATDDVDEMYVFRTYEDEEDF